ncbi:MAG: exonuclease SbcCD subunit D [Lachnospiraceae bacterium]
MKLIHCADLHLDSKMNTNLDKEKAKERNAELLRTFDRMIAYADACQIAGILIAGDLFDTKSVSATVRNAVEAVILDHPEIVFYYLKGNHDADNFLSNLERIPDNLKLFGSEWKSYDLGKVVISGLELSAENTDRAYVSLMLDGKKFNIVMLHGQESETGAKDRTEIIHLRALKNRGIDYLALGHVHSYKKERLDGRGIYCYPGCLEGRGFDECGEHGFTVLDIDEENGTYSHEFVPFASRKLYTEAVDVSGCLSTGDIASRILEVLEERDYSRKSLIRIRLKGFVDVDCEKDLNYLTAIFSNDYYFFKVDDETGWKVEVEDYLLDESLKGEFVRMVMNASEMSEEEKKEVIRYGLQAIAGEEVL